MANKTKQTKSAIRYLQRVAEDEYVQNQLRTAATRLREVYGRATRQGAKAAEDKKLYAKIREAATSIRRAAGAVQEPPPKAKHRRRRASLLGAAAVAAAAFAKKKRGGQADLPPKPAEARADEPAPEPSRAQTAA
jgi:hypothetical protein